MIIGVVFLIIVVGVVCFSVGFGKGYETGYSDKENEKTNNAHVKRGEAHTMVEDSSWIDSPHYPRF